MKRKGMCFFIAAAGTLSVAGCGNLTSIHHRFTPDDGQSISIDAKQRVVYSLPATDDPDKKRRVLCAEPSPDALSAISAAGGLSVETVKAALASNFSSSESAASIGLRTQTIQILRDAMYRLCEGHASGALSAFAFEKLQRKYQNNMLGLLAIEQLTGTVVAKQVALTGRAASHVSSIFELARMLEEAIDEKAKADVALEDAKKDKGKRDKEVADAQAAYDKELAAQKNDPNAASVLKIKTEQLDPAKAAQTKAIAALSTAETRVKAAAQLVASLEKAVSEGGKLSAEALSQAAFEAVSGAPMANARTAKEMSSAVYQIVRDLIDKDYSREICLDIVIEGAIKKFSQEQLTVIINTCEGKNQAARTAARAEERPGAPMTTREAPIDPKVFERLRESVKSFPSIR